jgi:Protein kinase domain
LSDIGAYRGSPDLGIPGIDSVSEIGRSPVATTYRVRDTATGRMVVVKVLNPAFLNAGLAERFDREQRAIEGLASHPNLVAVYGHGFTTNGQPYVVTEEVSGGSVALRLKGGRPMQGPDIVEIGVRVAGALESAHRAGVVHGDLRADDILLSPTGEPLLAELGMVSASGVTPDRTDDPRRLAHVAPEVLQGQGVSPSSDVYSLGSILYSLLAGENAYVTAGDQSIIPVITRIASAPVPDLRPKGVPDQIADAVEKAMSKDPGQRPGSARELGRLLQQAQVALGLPMTEMTVLSRAGFAANHDAPVAPSPAFPPSSPPEPVTRGQRPGDAAATSRPSAPEPAPVSGGRSRLPLILGGIAAALVVVVGGIVLAGGGDDPEPPPDDSEVELTQVADDTGAIEVDVPEDWDDVDGQPFGNGLPNLRAAPDVDDLLGGFDGAGIDFTAFPAGDPNALFDPADEASMEAFLDAAAAADTGRGATFADACDDSERDDFDAGGFDGVVDTYTDCGEDETEMLVITAADSEETSGIAVLVVLADDDRAARDDILDSFEVSL